MSINLHNAEFIISATSTKDFPKNKLPQIVFAGKSNVGKSSVINRLLNRKNFARVGASPGKTTHINYFCIDNKIYFVDLPGYGYAKVSHAEKERWGRLLDEFFNREESFQLGVFIVDARHKPTNDDLIMAEWFKQTEVPYCVIANKADKLKKSQCDAAVSLIAETLDISESAVLLFSAEKGTGKQELLSLIFQATNQ